MSGPRRFTATSGLLLAASIPIALIAAGFYPTFAARQATDTSRPGDAEVLEAAGRQLSTVTARLMPSVVKIRCRHASSRGGTVEETGSGVILRHPVTGRLIVVTNAHVVGSAEADSLQIHLHDGRVIQPKRIRIDSASDVAVLEVSASGLTPAQWGDSERLQIGNFVIAAGSPFDLSHSVSLGIISAKGRRSLQLGGGKVINQDFLQTDAAINPGNSGGPLVDVRGRVVGINTAIATTNGSGSGVAFSIPIRMVRRIVDDLLQFGRVRRAYLGVVLDPDFTTAEARSLKLSRRRGARVLNVSPGTPAARARMQINDVVTRFQQTTVVDFDHLIHLVSLEPIGNTVTLAVWRGGRQIEVRVSLTDRDLLTGK
jgi:serine protease Do